jgi:hypothetical protein
MAKTNYNGQEVETIDCTPTWEGVLPALLAVIQDGNAEGKRTAIAELRNMAKAADQFRKVALVTDSEVNNANGKTKLELVSDNAQMIFWQAVAMNYPECESGDFPPDASIMFSNSCNKAIDVWLMFNTPDNDTYKEQYNYNSKIG